MNPVFMIEFLGFDLAVLAWAGYEIWSVRKSKFPVQDTEQKNVSSENPPRHPEG